MSDKGRLRNALDKFLREFNFGDIIARILTFTREKDETEWLEFIGKMIDLLIKTTKDIPELQQLFIDTKNQKHQLGEAILSSTATTAAGGAVSGMLAPLFRKMNMEIDKGLHSNIVPYEIINLLWYQNRLDFDKYKDYMSRHGFSDEDRQILFNSLKVRLGIPEIFKLYLRDTELKDHWKEVLNSRFYSTPETDDFIKANLQYPTPVDHIQFAVREAYNEEQVKFLGLDRDLPTQAQEEAEKSGLAPGYFKYFWYSHWQLPPLTLGYQFLHRFRHETGSLKFTTDDLGKLIKALDFSPVWHERMIAASYNTLTRVDIRRMLKARVIDEPRILKEYYKDGYDDNDAQALTDYAIWENASSMRDLSTAKIGEALKLGIMTELEAQTGLEELRTDPDDIPRQMALWRYEIKKSQIDADVDYLAAQYMNNEIDEQNLRSQLTQLGLSPNNVYVAITNLNAKRKRSVTPLTTGEIYQMFVENIISPVEALTELQVRGVSKINADRQMKLLSIKKQRETDKEVIEQQEKLEKERAKTVQSEKTIALAEVSVAIAELNAETADLKVIYPDLTDTDTISAVDKRLLAIKQEIAYLQLEKTSINLKFAKELKTNGTA